MKSKMKVEFSGSFHSARLALSRYNNGNDHYTVAIVDFEPTDFDETVRVLTDGLEDAELTADELRKLAAGFIEVADKLDAADEVTSPPTDKSAPINCFSSGSDRICANDRVVVEGGKHHGRTGVVKNVFQDGEAFVLFGDHGGGGDFVKWQNLLPRA